VAIALINLIFASSVVVDAQQFFIGFAKGLTQKDLTVDVQHCVTSGSAVVNDLTTVVNDLKEKSLEGLIKAFTDIKASVADVQSTIATCKN